MYFTATLGLGRTGWEMQVTENERNGKEEEKKQSCAFSLVVDFDRYYMALLCFALL